MEARAINICRSGPPLEYAEDSEEDVTPLRIYKVEYEQGDRLFMTRILLEPAAEDLRAISTISQKLVEGACRASETRKGLLTLPDCVKGFESVFAKEDFNILPEHRQWDHVIELILGSEPKSSKVYPLSPVDKRSWTLSWKRTCVPDEFVPPNLPWQPRYSSSRKRTAPSSWFRTTEHSIS